MSHSKDFGLEVEIELTERRLSFLKELLEFRKKKQEEHSDHYAISYKLNKKGRVIRVGCKCGEVTNYKVALNTIDDFKCPQERR